MVPGKTNGHKEPPPPPAELFEADEIDKGQVEGIGHVVLHSAILGDMWAHMNHTGTEAQRQEFGLRLLAASMTINGAALSYEDLRRVSFRKIKLLLALLPEIQAINGIQTTPDEGALPGKNEVGGGAGEA